MNFNPKYTLVMEGGDIIYPSISEQKRLYRRLIAILRQNDGRYEIVGRKESKRRTNPQNAYYWGVVIPRIRAEFERLGNICDNDLVHEFMKKNLGIRSVITVSNKADYVLKSTSKYTKQEFIDYLDKVVLFAHETLEIEIPEPTK